MPWRSARPIGYRNPANQKDLVGDSTHLYTPGNRPFRHHILARCCVGATTRLSP
jgi:hypothetical protein